MRIALKFRREPALDVTAFVENKCLRFSRPYGQAYSTYLCYKYFIAIEKNRYQYFYRNIGET